MTFASHPFSNATEPRSPQTGLTDSEKEYIRSLGFALRGYPAHSVIVRHGQDDERVFFVDAGWGCVCHDLADGQRQVLDFPLKGDVVLPQLSANRALESFVARTDLAVFEAPAAKLALVATHSHRLSSILIEAVARQRAIVAQHLTNIGRRNALERTAHLLLELATRLEHAGVMTHFGYDCPLTQYDLADALGLSAIHVNRMLRELRERKLLEFHHGYVRLLDRQGLAEFINFDAGYIDG